MNLPKNFIFHTLKGIDGYSTCKLNNIDVARVKSINYRERSFKIFEKDHPFVLMIDYSLKKIENSVSPVITTGVHFGFTPTQNITEIQSITKRYKTEKDCKQEISEIISKQKALALLQNKMHEDVNKIIAGRDTRENKIILNVSNLKE